MAGKRGFAAMDQEKQRAIASKGGRAAHQKGTAHEFTSEEAAAAGRKGGEKVSRNRQHMAEIGRRGGKAAHRNAATRAAQGESAAVFERPVAQEREAGKESFATPVGGEDRQGAAQAPPTATQPAQHEPETGEARRHDEGGRNGNGQHGTSEPTAVVLERPAEPIVPLEPASPPGGGRP